MKRRFAALFCAVLFCGAAGGCAEIGASSELPSSGAEALSEPPLTEEDWDEPLPDFLDEEQQALYLRAKAIFPVFSGDTTNIDSMFGGEAGGESFEQVSVRYCISTGRYRQWADFMEMMRSIFTEEYIAELTGAETDSPAFFEKDGLLCYLEGARGSRFGYQEPDEFQLTEETDPSTSSAITCPSAEGKSTRNPTRSAWSGQKRAGGLRNLPARSSIVLREGT